MQESTKIYNLMIIMEDGDSFSAVSFPYSSRYQAEYEEELVDEEFPNAIATAISETILDNGLFVPHNDEESKVIH